MIDNCRNNDADDTGDGEFDGQPERDDEHSDIQGERGRESEALAVIQPWKGGDPACQMTDKTAEDDAGQHE